MRQLIIAVTLLIPTGASAGVVADPVIVLSQGDFADWAAASAAFDQCISSVALRGDVSGTCRQLSVFLAGFAARVNASKPPPPTPAASPPGK